MASSTLVAIIHSLKKVLYRRGNIARITQERGQNIITNEPEQGR
jgi:hypothetical protein